MCDQETSQWRDDFFFFLRFAIQGRNITKIEKDSKVIKNNNILRVFQKENGNDLKFVCNLFRTRWTVPVFFARKSLGRRVPCIVKPSTRFSDKKRGNVPSLPT